MHDKRLVFVVVCSRVHASLPKWQYAIGIFPLIIQQVGLTISCVQVTSCQTVSLDIGSLILFSIKSFLSNLQIM